LSAYRQGDDVRLFSRNRFPQNLPAVIVTRRYEQKSIVLTTNLAFRDWHTIFPNASCAVGLIDRLTHHAAIAIRRSDRLGGLVHEYDRAA
jgi:DNA replication protein DnaC